MGSHRSQLSGIRGHFSRVTSTGSFIPEIDGLRFVAIIAVILFHLAINLASRNPHAYSYPKPDSVTRITLRGGDFGVQLFFIVSGFVLALPFARHHIVNGPKVGLKAYFMRRVTRLEPPYIIAMVGIFIFLVVVHGHNPTRLFPHLLASLAYLHDLIYGTDSLVNNVAWSLEVEIQFYLLVPLLTMLFAVKQPRYRRGLIALTIVVMSVIGPIIAHQSSHLENSILRFSQYFLVGFLLADLMTSKQLRPVKRNALWDVLVVATIPLIIMLHTGTGLGSVLGGTATRESKLALILLPWLCFLAYVGVFRGVVANAVLTYPWITTVGGMCYSIYLLHNVFLNNVLGATKSFAPSSSYTVDFALQAIVMVPLIVIVSSVFFVLIERPCMDKNWPAKLRARVHARNSAPIAPAAVPVPSDTPLREDTPVRQDTPLRENTPPRENTAGQQDTPARADLS
jgi:peptidoglycan/LPS O-acetylase OafA/YrhL